MHKCITTRIDSFLPDFFTTSQSFLPENKAGRLVLGKDLEEGTKGNNQPLQVVTDGITEILSYKYDQELFYAEFNHKVFEAYFGGNNFWLYSTFSSAIQQCHVHHYSHSGITEKDR
jgi:hypothetical protein